MRSRRGIAVVAVEVERPLLPRGRVGELLLRARGPELDLDAVRSHVIALRVLLPEVAQGDEGRGPRTGKARPAAALFAARPGLAVEPDLISDVGRLQDVGARPAFGRV